MKVYFLQSYYDYEPTLYGVFSSRENAIEAMGKIKNTWSDGFEIITFEFDKPVEDGILDLDQSEVFRKEDKKPKKWRA